MTSAVRVQRLAFASGADSWSVATDDGLIAPVERFLAHLTAIEQSPNTVRAYAHDLRDYFDFLRIKDLLWDRVSLEDIGGFIAWLRLPRPARHGERVVPLFERGVSAATVNRKLSALSSFYEFHRRHGVDLGELITTWKFGSTRRGSWKPFLAHLGPREERRRQVALTAERRQPRAVSEPEVATLLAACDSLASRLLLTVLRYAGFRIGEALGLRHEDVDARRRELSIVDRPNVDGARPKSHGRTVPVSPELIRLYSDYLHDEYGTLDNDYVFVQFGGTGLGTRSTIAPSTVWSGGYASAPASSSRPRLTPRSLSA